MPVLQWHWQSTGYACVYNDTDILLAMPVSTVTLLQSHGSPCVYNNIRIFSWLYACVYNDPAISAPAVAVFWPWILTCVMDVRTHYDMCVHWLWLSSVLKFSPAWWTSELITICVDIGCDCLLFVSSHLRDGRQLNTICVYTVFSRLCGDVVRTLYCVCTQETSSFTCVEI